MSIHIEDEITTPQSTGAVAFDADPVTTEAVADNRSTGAVEYVAPGKTEVTHLGDAVVSTATLSEPVISTVSWLADVQTKPVTAPETPEPTTKPKRAQTKRTAKAGSKTAPEAE